MTNTPKVAASTENLFGGLMNKTPAQPTGAAPVVVAEVVVPPEEPVAPVTDQLTILKDRARMMGISFSNSIGIDALREKIRAKQEGASEPVVEETPEPAADEGVLKDPLADETVVKAKVKPPREKTLRETLFEREMKLVRLRISNLDPKKKDLPGEIFTFANRILGAVKKYIPYGEATDNGYMVPYCIYKQLRDRKFLQIKVIKKNGREHVQTGYVREFSLEILPLPTVQELANLAAAQAAAGGLD